MDDEDIQTGSSASGDGEGATAGGQMLPNAMLTEETKAELLQKYGKYGRIIGFKQLPLRKDEDPTYTHDERPRLQVTFENGESKRFTVTIRAPRPSTGDFITYEGEGEEKATAKPAVATRVVRSEKDGKNHIMEKDPATGEFSIDRGLASAQPSDSQERTQTIVQADGKAHVMGWNPSTNKYDIDQGLAVQQPTPAKPKPTDPSGWKPVTTPDGRVVGMLDPATGDVQPVTQRDAKTVETKDGRILSINADGSGAKDITPTNPNDKAPPKELEFIPDDNEPDGGLAAYNSRLMDAWRAGSISKQAGIDLLKRAGEIYEARETVTARRRGDANTTYGHDISQRGQSLDEVQSRRSSADNQFGRVNDTVSKYGATLIPSATSGQTVVDAYRAMLNMAHDHADAAGGYQDVPQIQKPAILGGPSGDGSDATQVVMHPGGAMTISPVGSAVPGSAVGAVGAGVTATTQAAVDPSGANVQAANDATQQGSQAAFGALGIPPVAAPPPVNPAAGEPGNDPTKPVGLFNPDPHMQALVDMGLTPDEAQNAVALYKRGVRSDHL